MQHGSCKQLFHFYSHAMSKYINPFTDVGFKKIFGQEINKDLLIDFLNSLLKGERFKDDRSLIYDVYCETDSGEKIIVEMQNKSQPYFKSRSIYYAAVHEGCFGM